MSQTEATTVSPTPVRALERAYFENFDFGTLDTSIEALLKAGVHFGHVSSRRHPKMAPFIFTTRKNISIMNLEQTKELLEQAAAFLEGVVKSGKPVLFVGIKKQTHDAVRSLAHRVGQSYVVDRWLGGTLTNAQQIRGRAKYLIDSERQEEAGEFKKYTKFEQQKKAEEIEKLEHKVGGLKRLETLPGALVIADAKEASLAIKEARRMKVPIVAIVDSNTDPSVIDYPIPGNDDALSSLHLLLGRLGQAVLAGAPKTPKA
ncbi:MAG: 30S ribosomal protein S2 [Candidatus Moraniibacteriota bacterium]|nr:MAG: 30S ribosomal protein S2 [Candidatus Moranbacteria bacterium]